MKNGLERFSQVTGGWVGTWRLPAHLGLHDLQWTSLLFPSSNDETLFTLRFRKRTPLVARWPGRVMGPPQAHSMGSLGGPIAGPESLPPPCMASVARSDADLPPAITTSDAQPDLNVSPPMSATLVEANVQISRVEALVSSLRQQVAA